MLKKIVMKYIILTMKSRNSCENYYGTKYNKLVFIIKKDIYLC